MLHFQNKKANIFSRPQCLVNISGIYGNFITSAELYIVIQMPLIFNVIPHGPRSACIKFQNWWRERVRCKAVRAVFCPLSPPQFGMRASRKDMILDSFFSKIQNLEKKKKKEKMKADRAYL